MPITEKVKSYEDVCKIKGIDSVNSLPFPDPQTEEEKAINGFTKVIRAIEVLNEGWRPNWDNWDEYKYYPWWDLRAAAGSAPGFSCSGCGYVYSGSGLGSRLVLKSRELAKHVAKYFIEDYKAFMVLEK